MGGAGAAATYLAKRLECAGSPALWSEVGCRMLDAGCRSRERLANRSTE
jgi:hypothetical protein